MHITRNQLKSLSACSSGMKNFGRAFKGTKGGVEITPANVAKFMESGCADQVNWLLCTLGCMRTAEIRGLHYDLNNTLSPIKAEISEKYDPPCVTERKLYQAAQDERNTLIDNATMVAYKPYLIIEKEINEKFNALPETQDEDELLERRIQRMIELKGADIRRHERLMVDHAKLYRQYDPILDQHRGQYDTLTSERQKAMIDAINKHLSPWYELVSDELNRLAAIKFA